MDSGSPTKLFRDLPTGDCAVDSEDVVEFGNLGGGLQNCCEILRRFSKLSPNALMYFKSDIKIL